MVKWTEIMLRYTKTLIIFCQRPKSSTKVLFRLVLCFIFIFFMMTFVVVLHTQTQNIKLRFSKCIIKIDAQKQVNEFGYGHKFTNSNILNLEFFFFIFLESIIISRASSHNFQLNQNLSKFKQLLFNHFVQRHLLAHHLHCRLKHVDFYRDFFLGHHKLHGFVTQYDFKISIIFFLHKTQSLCIVLTHFHLILGMDQQCPLYRACTPPNHKRLTYIELTCKLHRASKVCTRHQKYVYILSIYTTSNHVYGTFHFVSKTMPLCKNYAKSHRAFYLKSCCVSINNLVL